MQRDLSNNTNGHFFEALEPRVLMSGDAMPDLTTGEPATIEVAIAIPAYQDYTVRSKVSDGLSYQPAESGPALTNGEPAVTGIDRYAADVQAADDLLQSSAETKPAEFFEALIVETNMPALNPVDRN